MNEQKKVSFTRMDQGTREDFRQLLELERDEQAQHPARILSMLEELQGVDTCYQVDRYTHSLQAATRALRDAADEETIVCALLHDVGDLYAPDNHAEFAAALLAPYIGEKNLWIIRHHGIFQGYYYFHHWGLDRNERERFRGHPYFTDCERFCERWDQVSFDPDYDTLPVDAFEPMLVRLLSRRK